VISASGSATAVRDAVAKIADGGTITLAAGTYELDQLLTINKSVQLVGAGMAQTSIVSTVKDKGVLFTGAHRFSTSGITFSHEGATPGGVVWSMPAPSISATVALPEPLRTAATGSTRPCGCAAPRPAWSRTAQQTKATSVSASADC
jgi:hypothetical protein